MDTKRDDELLGEIADRNQEAMTVFYDRYFGKVQGLCRRMISDRDLADETVQDVFWTVWQNAAKYDASRASPATWLFIIARSRCRDALRRLQSQPASAPLNDWDPSDSDLVAEVFEHIDRQALLRGLNRLPDAQREVLTDVYILGFSAAEVARARQLPLGTVKTRMRLGLEKLRDWMGKEVGVDDA